MVIVQAVALQVRGGVSNVAQRACILSCMKWMCKHRAPFVPRFRRKETCNQVRRDIGEILRRLCEYGASR